MNKSLITQKAWGGKGFRPSNLTKHFSRFGGVLIFVGIGFCFLIYGICTYVNDEAFVENAIRAEATIETVRDELITYGGMSRWDSHVRIAHECSYTLKFLPKEKTDPVSAGLKVFTSSCLGKNETVTILYDPGNPQDVAIFLGFSEGTPISKIWIILGGAFILYSGFCWAAVNARRLG